MADKYQILLAREPESRADHGASISPSTEKTRAEGIVTALREGILSGDLPPGSALRFPVLRERFGASMGTLREALTILAASRLVIARGQRGFRVAPLSQTELRDLMERRIEIGSIALRRSISFGDSEWEAHIVASFHLLTKAAFPQPGAPSRNSREFERRLTTFYRALVEACESPWLLHFHDALAEHSGRYRRLPMTPKGLTLAQPLIPFHRAVMEATLARDADRACAVLTELLKATFVISEEILASALVTGAAPDPRASGRRKGGERRPRSQASPD